MGLEHEDKGERPQNGKVLPLIAAIHRHLILRLALGGTVSLLLSVILCVDGIYQGFNLELWIFVGFFTSVSLLVTLFSWRWLFSHRRPKPGNSGKDPADQTRTGQDGAH